MRNKPPERSAGTVRRSPAGKPLRWSRGWSVVAAVWLAIGGLLLIVRLDMGHLTTWTPREAAAVAAVRAYTPDGTHRCDELLVRLADELARRSGCGASPMWYAFDRPWEHRVYVAWEWGDQANLSFIVQGGVVVPDEDTRLLLEAVGQPSPLR